MTVVTRTFNEIDVLGRVWMPAVKAAMTYTPSADDVAAMARHSQHLSKADGGALPKGENHASDQYMRAAVLDWLDTHARDFQQIIDFRADFDLPFSYKSDFASEENEFDFADCVYGGEDEFEAKG